MSALTKKISNNFNKVADYINDRPGVVLGMGTGAIWGGSGISLAAAAIAAGPVTAVVLPAFAVGAAVGGVIGHQVDKNDAKKQKSATPKPKL